MKLAQYAIQIACFPSPCGLLTEVCPVALTREPPDSKQLKLAGRILGQASEDLWTLEEMMASAEYGYWEDQEIETVVLLAKDWRRVVRAGNELMRLNPRFDRVYADQRDAALEEIAANLVAALTRHDLEMLGRLATYNL